MTVKSRQWGAQVARIQDIWEDRDSWSNQEEWRKQELLELWKLCNLSAEIFETNEEKFTNEVTPDNAVELLMSGLLWPVMVSGIDPSNHNQRDLMRIRDIISNLRGIDIPFTEEEADEILAGDMSEENR